MAKARERDPSAELAELESAVRAGQLARGYALRGEERYFRERAIARLREAAEKQGFELCLHEVERENEGSDFRLARLIDDLSGGGLFAARRLVVVRNPGELLRSVEGEKSALVRAALAFVTSDADAGTLVVSDPSLRADHVLVKALLAAGGVAPAFRRLYETPPPWRPDPRQSELVQWAARRARELGLALTDEQALYVSAATGNDLAALDDQLELLRSSGGRDLASVVSWTAGATPWDVADRILAGELPRALGGIQALFGGGFQEKSGKRLLEAAPLSILLIGALQRGASACLALALDPDSERAGNGPPRQVEAQRERAGRRSALDWRALLEDATDLERAAKSGGVDAGDFARFALRWSAGGAPRRTATGARA